MDIPEGEKREKGADGLFKEIISENFPNLGKELDIQVHEAKRRPIIRSLMKNDFLKKCYIKTVQSQRKKKIKAARGKNLGKLQSKLH